MVEYSEHDGQLVTIQVTQNGPYLVKGKVKLVNTDGSDVELKSNNEVIALCRCTGSKNFPFCDGTHAKSKKIS